jgi:hypothetical protein
MKNDQCKLKQRLSIANQSSISNHNAKWEGQFAMGNHQ